MWPFSKEYDLTGLRRDDKGNIVFDLTTEEKQAVEDAFRTFEGSSVRPDVYDDFRNGTTALALSLYANKQALMSTIESSEEERKKLLDKAITAIGKAYSIYQLPIYIYDFACFLEKSNRWDLAKNMFKDFLKQQSKFKPRPLDEGFLRRRDIDAATKDAKVKLDPTNPMAWIDKGNSLDGSGRFNEAIECFDKAIELDPVIADAWVGKAGCLGRLGRLNEALECAALL